jgi:hypothetical protein
MRVGIFVAGCVLLVQGIIVGSIGGSIYNQSISQYIPGLGYFPFSFNPVAIFAIIFGTVSTIVGIILIPVGAIRKSKVNLPKLQSQLQQQWQQQAVVIVPPELTPPAMQATQVPDQLETKYCSGCGSPVPSGQQFCGSCGTKIN